MVQASTQAVAKGSSAMQALWLESASVEPSLTKEQPSLVTFDMHLLCNTVPARDDESSLMQQGRCDISQGPRRVSSYYSVNAVTVAASQPPGPFPPQAPAPESLRCGKWFMVACCTPNVASFWYVLIASYNSLSRVRTKQSFPCPFKAAFKFWFQTPSSRRRRRCRGLARSRFGLWR